MWLQLRTTTSPTEGLTLVVASTGFVVEYFLTSIDTNQPADTLHTLIATPFTLG
jgi:hypothetical protein